LERIDDRTKIIFLCNPNNPTGTYWDRERLIGFLNALDGRQVVVLDEAYREFVDSDDFPDGMDLIEQYPNVVVFRTFSKMYGLAGLRIGYLAAGRELVGAIRRTCVVYSVNGLAQEAALAALNDDDHVVRTRTLVRDGKAFLVEKLNDFGLSSVVGEGNFLMVKLPLSDTLAYRKLMTLGVMVRTMTGFRFPNYIRITVSHREALEACISALGRVLKR
jgi:histidinol-phosphate aminotransferase